MPYDNTGKSHNNGVSNEEMNIDVLNRRSDIVYDIWSQMNGVPYIAKQVGGTKTVVDGIVTFYTPDGEVDYSISMKNADQESSTHDWINCSSEVKKDHVLWGPWARTISDIRDDKDNLSYAKAEALQNIGRDTVMKNLSSNASEVKDFFRKHIINRNMGKYVIRHSKKTSSLQVYKFDDHPMVEYFKSMSLKFMGTKKSRMIRFLDAQGKEHDCGLRIRIQTNNGTTALLGLNEGKVNSKGNAKNNNASAVIKIQQEKITSTVLPKLKQKGKLKTYKI